MANPRAVDAYLQNFQQWLLATSFIPAKGISDGWQGLINIDWEDPETGVWNSSAHHVLIILPPGFPYHAPVVLSRDTPPLLPSWHLSPEGSLCLWREPGGWNPFMSAQKLLARVNDWFRYYHTGGWPEDFTPTDLHLYLQNQGAVVIGEEWKPEFAVKQGSFTLWQNNTFTMIPCLVGLKNSQGKADKEKRLLDQLGWLEKGVQSYHGVWFRVNTPFVPSNRLDYLLNQIDQYSGTSSGSAHAYLIKQLGRVTSSGGIPLAIGYPGILGQEQWSFLWLTKPIGRKIHLSRPELMEKIEVKSFETAPAGKGDLLRRTFHLSKDLGNKKVALFGVGALGGSVALLLAKAGLGEIRLIDSDKVKPTNVIRHVAGLDDVGFPKTFSVNRKILRHNPDCHVVTFPETWQTQELDKIINDVDLVIDTTANSAFSLWLNQLIVQKMGTILYAAAYRRASIGRLILYRGNGLRTDPCLACYLLNEEDWNDEDYPFIPIDPTSTFEEEGCISVTEEADAIHVELVAGQCALTAVKFLSGQSFSENLFIQVNEGLPDVHNILSKPGFYTIHNTAPLNCQLCNQES